MSMKRLAMTAALVGGVLAAQPGWGADTRSPCYTQSAIEAEQAIRYITDVMVASSACQNTTYAEFRLRNKDAIIAYQKALISHFRGESGFRSLEHRARQHRGAEAGDRQSRRVLPAIRDADATGQGPRSERVPRLCRGPGDRGRRAIRQMRRGQVVARRRRIPKPLPGIPGPDPGSGERPRRR